MVSNYLKQLCRLQLDRRVISRVHPSPDGPRDGRTAEGDQSSTPDGQASRYVATTNLMPSRLPLPWRWLFSSLFVYSFLGMPSAAGKPRSPTSTGKYHVCHSLHSICRSSYLAYFLSWASWHRVSHGTVSSITISFFVLYDISRTSGLCATLKEINSKSY